MNDSFLFHTALAGAAPRKRCFFYLNKRVRVNFFAYGNKFVSGAAAEEVKADCFSEVERNALSCFLYLRTGPPDCGGLIFCEWV